MTTAVTPEFLLAPFFCFQFSPGKLIFTCFILYVVSWAFPTDAVITFSFDVKLLHTISIYSFCWYLTFPLFFVLCFKTGGFFFFLQLHLRILWKHSLGGCGGTLSIISALRMERQEDYYIVSSRPAWAIDWNSKPKVNRLIKITVH